jgi:hypothetical protein
MGVAGEYLGINEELRWFGGLLKFSLKIGVVVFFIALFIGSSSESKHFSVTQLVMASFVAGFSTAVVIAVVLEVYEFFRGWGKTAATVAPFILIALLFLLLLSLGYVKLT